jgi:hypothetical protein
MTEFANAGIKHLAVVLRPEDHELADLLASETRFSSVEAIKREPLNGTLGSVLALVEHFGSSDHLISTCDVIVPPGSVDVLVRRASSAQTRSPVAVVLTSEHVHDGNPVWVHVTDEEIVCDFGKEAPPAPQVYGHIRWVSRSFIEVLDGVDLGGCTRDTEMLRRVVASCPGRVLAMDAGYVLDVDDENDLVAAHELLGVAGDQIAP